MVYLKHVTCRENLNLLHRQPEALGSMKDEDTRQQPSLVPRPSPTPFS